MVFRRGKMCRSPCVTELDVALLSNEYTDAARLLVLAETSSHELKEYSEGDEMSRKLARS